MSSTHGGILFILKKNENYNFVSYCRRSSGLWNSTRFIVESLLERGHKAHIVEVNDNNDIDREVTKHKPKIVVIEALWVVPSKFDILKKLHPHVSWVVHMHSHMPFLALEGNAMGWIKEYAHKGIGIIANSPESYEAFRCILPEDKVQFLPNVYISNPREPKIFKNNSRLNVGCFGAIRPLKNQLLQALAAIRFAHENQKHLYFHINASRIETGGDPVYKNLMQLFESEPHADLIHHKWYEPEEFLQLLQDEIDIGMQVSLTETFNIVCADYVTAGVPVVTSKEVKWASCYNKAQDDSVDDIVRVMGKVYQSRRLVERNQKMLRKYSIVAQKMWEEWLIANLR